MRAADSETMSQQIERAIATRRWVRAQTLIKREIARTPRSHWLLTRLGSTYYAQRQYKRALLYIEKALSLAPRCPLVLWDYACCLDMLGRTKECLAVCRRLLRRGVGRLAHGKCGEGNEWARGLVADCYYRMAQCYRDLGDNKRAAVAFRRHLALRGPGCRSIYPIAEVRKELRALARLVQR